ncbi:MAG: metallophosphoesterase, partial [Thermoplasmata archaeon]|nr:metallophosphoesterase [Thermoplasmata archaeon]
GLERLFIRINNPPLGQPLVLREGESIIVIADTHMGLRPNVFLDLMGRGSDCDLKAINSFTNWLTELTGSPEGSGNDPSTLEDITWWDGGEGKAKTKSLERPRYVILLGDILEWADGWQESVQLAMTSTLSKFNRLGPKTEVVYVVGNHDDVHIRDRTPDLRTTGTTPDAVNPNEINVVPEVWPGPEEPWGSVNRPIKAGRSQYLFVHGHQWRLWYQFWGSFAYLPGLLRRAGQLGYYMWLLFPILLAMIWCLVHFQEPETLIIAASIFLVLLIILVPVGYMTLARIVFNMIDYPRYNNKKGLGWFHRWWMRTAGGDRPGSGGGEQDEIKVVYGHTHNTDIVRVVDSKSRVDLRWDADRSRPGDSVCTLLNVPSWIKDHHKPMERGIFLYIDNAHHLFMGWDWKKRRPFHIPDSLIMGRGTNWTSVKGDSKERIRGMVTDLGWPAPFRDRWFDSKEWRRKGHRDPDKASRADRASKGR